MRRNREREISAINVASEHLGALILSAIAVYTYVALAVASTTQEDLLVGKSLSLPLLETPVPLEYFYIAAPLLVLMLHGYTLLNERLVFEKATQFQEIELLFPHLQWQGFIVLMLRNDFIGFLGRCFFFVSGALVPLLLLLFIEFRFLPFRRLDATLLQCGGILVDAAFVALIAGWKNIREVVPRRWRLLFIGVGLIVALVAVGFLIIALRKPGLPSPAFQAKISRLACLDLPEAHLIKEEPEGAKLNEFGERADALLRYGTGADLRKRDLSYAYLERALLVNADLRQANFTGADLSYADFRRTNLTGANFSGATLVGARFDGSFGENVIFEGASLEAAHLSGVKLKTASFRNADLTGTEIHWSTFEKGNFDLANLDRASLLGTKFDETSFIGAQFPGAVAWKNYFLKTNILLARFNEARLQGSRFELLKKEAGQSDGALFDAAEIQFVEAQNLNGISLRGAKVSKRGTHLGFPRLVDFRGIRVEEPAEYLHWQKEAQKNRSDFRRYIGRREGDWFEEEWKERDGLLRERLKNSCIFCAKGNSRISGCGDGCVLAFDNKSLELGFVTSRDKMVVAEEVQRQILVVLMAQARDSDDVRTAILRELRNCFSPSRDPEWSPSQRAELERFLHNEGKDQESACPWWQGPARGM